MSEQERVNAGVQPATGAGEPTPIIFLDDIRVTFKTRTGSILHPNKVQAVRGLTPSSCPAKPWASWANPAAASPPRPT